MIIEAIEFKLKDGRHACLRCPTVDDAEGNLEVIRTASGETKFLARYPEEWNISVEDEARWIEGRRNSSDGLALVCDVDGKVVGNCEIMFKGGMKQSHLASVGIAILREYWGLGIGSAMFRAMIDAAEERGTEVIELGFIEGNDRGRRLYEKFGFTVVAEIPKKFKLRDGSYRSEFLMQKYLK